MIGENHDCPAFINQIHKTADIIISNFIGGFCKFYNFFFIVLRSIAIFHILHVVMTLKVDVVHMGEDDFYTFFFDHVVHNFGLPFCSFDPLFVVAL